MKTVMLLLNGFGVEHKNSYSIYDKEVMPNFDMLFAKYINAKLTANVNNYRDGYRNMCMGINEMYNYSIYEEVMKNDTIKTNPILLNLKQELDARKSKVHIFCFVDNSMKIVEQLKSFLKEVNPDMNKKVFIHIVLTSNNIEDYKIITNILAKMNVDLGEYVKIGLIFGLATISNSNPITELNFFFRILISEVGEKWQSYSQKLEVSYGLKQIPALLKPFVVNDGFSLDKNDLFMIWNYDKVDLSNFLELTRNVKYGEESNTFKFYSLFELTAKEKVDFMLTYKVSNKSLANKLKDLNAKALILAKKDQINIINYYANGMQSIVNENISFIESDNYLYKPKELLDIINNSNQDLIIINYSIEGAKNIEELKQILHNVDIMVGNIYENSKGSKYALLISSLYGINVVLNNQKGEICNVIFSEKLPIIYADDFLTRKDYIITDGYTISDLLPICYKSIDRKYKGESILIKKNALYKLFFK